TGRPPPSARRPHGRLPPHRRGARPAVGGGHLPTTLATPPGVARPPHRLPEAEHLLARVPQSVPPRTPDDPGGQRPLFLLPGPPAGGDAGHVGGGPVLPGRGDVVSAAFLGRAEHLPRRAPAVLSPGSGGRRAVAARQAGMRPACAAAADSAPQEGATPARCGGRPLRWCFSLLARRFRVGWHASE